MLEVRAAQPLSAQLAPRFDQDPGSLVTREEAKQLCERLTREHPDRATHAWIARQEPSGDWSVAKVKLPDGITRDPLKATTEAKPRPPEADDPRPAIFRNIPPYGAA
jgi:hypothetical protein